MYIPQHFAVPDRPTLVQFINSHGFGQLISSHEGRLYTSHIPFIFDAEGNRLIGHLARANPQWRDISDQEILVTFQGPHGYVSPAWYHSPGVPTWNYQAVHVYGRCSVSEDPAHLEKTLYGLIDAHESRFEQPWSPDYEATRLNHIVGLEVAISEMQGKFKLSQNRPARDRQGVIEHLEALGEEALAGAMRHCNAD